MGSPEKRRPDRSSEAVGRRLFHCSVFLVSFSVFILLNACIGLSSAPFYARRTDCNLFNKSEQCDRLEKQARNLYGLDLITSILVCANGCLLMALSENLQHARLRRAGALSAKAGLFLFPLLFLARTTLFLEVVNELKSVNPEDYLTIYGMMFGVYAQSQAA